MHIPILAAIQFRFLAPVPTAAASEADDAVTRVDIGFPIQLEIEPVTALLQDNIVVSVSGTSGTATRKSMGATANYLIKISWRLKPLRSYRFIYSIVKLSLGSAKMIFIIISAAC